MNLNTHFTCPECHQDDCIEIYYLQNAKIIWDEEKQENRLEDQYYKSADLSDFIAEILCSNCGHTLYNKFEAEALHDN